MLLKKFEQLSPNFIDLFKKKKKGKEATHYGEHREVGQGPLSYCDLHHTLASSNCLGTHLQSLRIPRSPNFGQDLILPLRGRWNCILFERIHWEENSTNFSLEIHVNRITGQWKDSPFIQAPCCYWVYFLPIWTHSRLPGPGYISTDTMENLIFAFHVLTIGNLRLALANIKSTILTSMKTKVSRKQEVNWKGLDHDLFNKILGMFSYCICIHMLSRAHS